MGSIRDIVEQAYPALTQAGIDAIVTGLEEREDALADSVVDLAYEEFGVNRSLMTENLRRIGLGAPGQKPTLSIDEETAEQLLALIHEVKGVADRIDSLLKQAGH